MQPPSVKIKKGPLQTKRKKEVRESKGGKLRKKGAKMTCSNCGLQGHNKATCKNSNSKVPTKKTKEKNHKQGSNSTIRNPKPFSSFVVVSLVCPPLVNAHD